MNTKNLPKDITLQVEDLVAHGATYLDAIVTVSESFNIDVEDIIPRLSKVLINKLEVECINNGLVNGVQYLSLEDL